MVFPLREPFSVNWGGSPAFDELVSQLHKLQGICLATSTGGSRAKSDWREKLRSIQW